ncbi:MAG TPA: T9SS type B sorting domain-containing protein [Chitinophagaceae bacterium]|nr:T9SS type B sorting domain-containing protein [Chitinophagaceae bacterium]
MPEPVFNCRLVGLRFAFSLIIIAIVFNAQGQICNGSLGDPAVNITFGSAGSTTTYPAPGGYTYTSSACPNDGYYTITESTANCFGNTWHTVHNDHSGTGNFMLVNASYTPGDFFQTTVTDLCPNTTYEFASWVMNVMKPISSILPNIIFRIEAPNGTVLASYQTGDIGVTGAPQWIQYGFFFTTPANNATIVLRISNTAPGGYGNDLALDDITFRPCGAKITAGIVGSTIDTVDVCEGNTTTYVFAGSAASTYQSPVYHWQLSKDSGTTWVDIAGATNTSYTRTPTGAGSYWYRLTVVDASVAGVTSCRISSDIIVINIHPTPVVSAGPDRILLTGSSAILNGKAEGESLQYSWSPNNYISDITELAPVVTPPAAIDYTLSAVSSFGCRNEDRVFVKVVTGIYVPTAFTPNGDGNNDLWQIPFLDPAFEATVNVFNRFGGVVYHASSEIVSWDGKVKGVPQASGVYIYLITFKNSNLQLKGSLTLIR